MNHYKINRMYIDFKGENYCVDYAYLPVDPIFMMTQSSQVPEGEEYKVEIRSLYKQISSDEWTPAGEMRTHIEEIVKIKHRK